VERLYGTKFHYETLGIRTNYSRSIESSAYTSE